MDTPESLNDFLPDMSELSVLDVLNLLVGHTDLYFPTDKKEEYPENIVYALSQAFDGLDYERRSHGATYEDSLHYKLDISFYSFVTESVGLAITNGKGSFIKRLKAEVKKATGIKYSDSEWGMIGGVLANYKPRDKRRFDVTNRIDWQAGDYGDSGSCYWGCRKNARRILEDNGAFALRIYADDNEFVGKGRTWLYPAPNHNGVVAYNTYGPLGLPQTIEKFLKFLESVMNKTLYMRQIKLSFENDTCGTLWINGGTGILLSTVEYPRLSAINFTDVYNDDTHYGICAYCGDEIDIANDECAYIDDTYYCTNCYFTCYDCHNNHSIEFINHVAGDRVVCNRCLSHNYSSCENCDDYYSNDELNTTDDNYTLCEYCYDNHTCQCDKCGEVLYDTRLNRIDATYEYYCDSCYEAYNKALADEQSVSDDKEVVDLTNLLDYANETGTMGVIYEH